MVLKIGLLGDLGLSFGFCKEVIKYYDIIRLILERGDIRKKDYNLS